MNALQRKIEEAEKEFNQAMSEAKDATDKAMAGLFRTPHEKNVSARYARMWAARVQREIKNLGHVPSLAVSSDEDTSLFDENDGETEAERLMWAARDSYDMRDGK